MFPGLVTRFGLVTVGLALALVVGVTPAAQATETRRTTTPTVSATVVSRPCIPGNLKQVDGPPGRCTPSDSMSEGGCGWGRCVYFNRSEQKVILAGLLAGTAAGLCLMGPAVCVVAAVLAAMAYEFLAQRGGICGGNSPYGPYYKPTLQVRYFPNPGAAQCV